MRGSLGGPDAHFVQVPQQVGGVLVDTIRPARQSSPSSFKTSKRFFDAIGLGFSTCFGLTSRAFSPTSFRAFVEQLTTAVRYDTRNTDMMLRGTDIACPPFETYVNELVAAVQEHLKARQRRREGPADPEVEDPLS